MKSRKKKPQNKLYIEAGVANLATTTAILALTSSSGRNKAHSKGTKLDETGRYLVRHRRLTGVFLSSFRHACQAQLMGAISKCVADALKLGKGRIDYSIKYRRIRCEGPFEMVSWSQHVKLEWFILKHKMYYFKCAKVAPPPPPWGSTICHTNNLTIGYSTSPTKVTCHITNRCFSQ